MSTNIIQHIDDLIHDSQKTNNEKLFSICELLKSEIEHYDWVGFYSLNKNSNTLKLTCYAGKKTEHTEIAVGKGVCGQVAQSKKTMIVQDVHSIDNYIACSIDVQSEIVVPILNNGNFVAEIDIDSHAHAPFTDYDKKLLETIAQKVLHLF
jgi:GAF domain-containing protein